MILFTGRRGSGMTLAMARALTEHVAKGDETWANIHIKGVRFHRDLIGLPERRIVLGIDTALEVITQQEAAWSEKVERFVAWAERTKSVVYLTMQSFGVGVLHPLIQAATQVQCRFSQEDKHVTLTNINDGSSVRFDARPFFGVYDTTEIVGGRL